MLPAMMWLLYLREDMQILWCYTHSLQFRASIPRCFFPVKQIWEGLKNDNFLLCLLEHWGTHVSFCWGQKKQYFKLVDFWLHVFSNQTKGNTHHCVSWTTATFWLKLGVVFGRCRKQSAGLNVSTLPKRLPWVSLFPLFPYVGSKAKNHSTLDWMWQKMVGRAVPPFCFLQMAGNDWIVGAKFLVCVGIACKWR